ncbi:hypothetical protein E3U43_006232, partial [Larimichthys crocea]
SSDWPPFKGRQLSLAAACSLLPLLCCVQPRLRSLWWAMRCWPRSKGTSPLN